MQEKAAAEAEDAERQKSAANEVTTILVALPLLASRSCPIAALVVMHSLESRSDLHRQNRVRPLSTESLRGCIYGKPDQVPGPFKSTREPFVNTVAQPRATQDGVSWVVDIFISSTFVDM